jgi:hypothetical protein
MPADLPVEQPTKFELLVSAVQSRPCPPGFSLEDSFLPFGCAFLGKHSGSLQRMHYTFPSLETRALHSCSGPMERRLTKSGSDDDGPFESNLFPPSPVDFVWTEA